MSFCAPAAARRAPGAATQRGGILFRLLVALSVLIVIGAVYLLRRPLLRFAGSLLVVDEAPLPADAIVVLGDDNYPADRAAHAAALYRDRWAPRVLASGRYLRPYASIADLMHRDLVERGVPSEAVVRFANHGSNTREEAIAVNQFARQQRWRRLIVVTSNFHTRRASYIFHRVLDPSIQVRIVAARDSGFDPDTWWYSRHGVKTLFLESVAFCVAVWELATADSPSPTPSAAPAPAPAPR